MKSSSFELKISSLELKSLSFELKNSRFELRTSSFELKKSSFESKYSSFELKCSSFKLKFTSFKLKCAVRKIRTCGSCRSESFRTQCQDLFTSFIQDSVDKHIPSILVVGMGDGAGRVGYIFFIFLICLHFLMSCLFGRRQNMTEIYCGFGC